MANESWTNMSFDQAVQVNPPVSLQRGHAYPFVEMEAVNQNFRSVYPSETREFTGGGSRFMNGDTLMARITPCLENGKIARFAATSETTVGHGSTEFIVIRGRPNVTDTAFAYYLTRWDGVRQYLISQMTGSSGRQRVPTSALSHRKVAIPPINEQRAIACILGALDDKIELNRRMNETLEQIAQAIFKQWFIEPTRDARQKNGGQGLPEGWREGTLEELCVQNRENLNPAEFPNELFDHFSIPAFDEGRTPKPETGDAIKSNKFLVPNDSVLVSRLNPRIPRVWMPALTQDRRAICSTEFFVAVPKVGISREFLFSLFSNDAFNAVFATMVTGTSGSHQRVKPESVLAMSVSIPPKEQIELFTQLSMPLINRINANLAESATLAALRDALLPKLISGELRVKDAERIVGRCA